MRIALLLVVVSSAACVTTRSVAADPYVSLGEPPLPARWTLTNVAVMPPTNPELANHRFTTMLQQLEGHLRASLEGEPALGVHQPDVRQADYAVELELRLVEGAAVNGYYGVSLASSVAGPSVGALVGAAVGGPVAPLASIVGAVIGGAVAVIGSTLTPSATYSGQLEAAVTVRRASDGVEVARRTVRSEWDALLNAYGAEDKLASAAGHAVPEVEREVARALRAAFVSLGVGERGGQATFDGRALDPASGASPRQM